MKLSSIRRSSYVIWFGMVFFAVCWIAAALADPSWEFGVATMSELGISDTVAKYWFLAGCVGAGFCLTLYGIFEVSTTTNKIHRYVYYILQLAGILLVGVGVFTMDFGRMHSFFAVTFFLTMAIVMVVYASYAVNEKKMFMSMFTWIILGFAVVLLAITPIALVEPISVILFAIWILSVDVLKYIRVEDLCLES